MKITEIEKGDFISTEVKKYYSKETWSFRDKELPVNIYKFKNFKFGIDYNRVPFLHKLISLIK
jgi:hypothetical protein